MIVRRIFPEADDPIEIGTPDARERLSALYELPAPKWVRLNLISSVSGSAAGADGTSETLTNRADRKILGIIRRLSDVVLVGASSVRAEGYQLPRTTPLAIVTSSGDLGGHRIESAPGGVRPFVICPASVASKVHNALAEADIITVPDTNGRLAAVHLLSALRDRGLARIVCEGGPSLAGQLLNAGLVDELCLSTSPVLGGVDLPLFGGSAIDAKRLRLRQVLVDDQSTLYARWTVSI